jgi:Chromosome segregation protein Spc25
MSGLLVVVVHSCRPKISGTGRMLFDLNKTNNFATFVLAMRKKFQELLT